jgi:hypothetical protein
MADHTIVVIGVVCIAAVLIGVVIGMYIICKKVVEDKKNPNSRGNESVEGPVVPIMTKEYAVTSIGSVNDEPNDPKRMDTVDIFSKSSSTDSWKSVSSKSNVSIDQKKPW